MFTMDLNISKSLYEEQYKDKMSYDAFIEVLEKGLNSEQAATPPSGTEPVNAMNIALEYNIDLMVKLLQDK